MNQHQAQILVTNVCNLRNNDNNAAIIHQTWHNVLYYEKAVHFFSDLVSR